MLPINVYEDRSVLSVEQRVETTQPVPPTFWRLVLTVLNKGVDNVCKVEGWLSIPSFMKLCLFLDAQVQMNLFTVCVIHAPTGES